MAENPESFRAQLGEIQLAGKAYAVLVDSYIQQSQDAFYEKFNTGIPQLTDLSTAQHVGDHSPFLATGHHIFAPQTLLDSNGFSLGNNGLTVLKIPSVVGSTTGTNIVLSNGIPEANAKPPFIFGGRELVWNGSGWTDGIITITFGFSEEQVVYAPPYVYLIKSGKIYYCLPLLDDTQNIVYSGGKLQLNTGAAIAIPSNITSLDVVKTNGTGEIIQGRDFQIEGETGKIKFLENSYAINGAPYTVSYLYQQLADATKAFSLPNVGGVPISYDLTYDNISSALIYNGVLEDILLPGRDYAMEPNSFGAKLLQTGRYRPGNFAITYLAMVPQRTTTTKTVTSKKIALDQKRILSTIAYDPSFTENNLTSRQDYEIQYEQGKIRFLINSLATVGKTYQVDYTKVTHPTAKETLTPAASITLANKRIVEFSIGRQGKQTFTPQMGPTMGFEVDKLTGSIRLGPEIRKSLCTTFDLNFKKSATELKKAKVSIGTGAMEVFDTDATKKIIGIPKIYRVLKPYGSDPTNLWVPLTEKYIYNDTSGTFTFHVRPEEIGKQIWLRGQKFGYVPFLTQAAWNAQYHQLPKNLTEQAINVYAYSSAGTPRQYAVGFSEPTYVNINAAGRTKKPIIELDKNGKPAYDIIIDVKNKTYFIPTGSSIPSTNNLSLTCVYLGHYTNQTKTLTDDAWTDLNPNSAVMSYIPEQDISIVQTLTDARKIAIAWGASGSDNSNIRINFDKKTNHLYVNTSGITGTLQAKYKSFEFIDGTSTITNTSPRNTWINLPTLSSLAIDCELVPDTITVTRQENYVFKYSCRDDWNYDSKSGMIFFNRMTNCASNLQKLIETVEQSWENKDYKLLPNGNPLILREIFPTLSSDFPIVTYDWGIYGSGSYTDYWAYQNWQSSLVMISVDSDLDDRYNENLQHTPFWFNPIEKSIQIDETVNLRKSGGDEVYISYIRGTAVDTTVSNLSISDGWIDLTGIADYKDIDLDTLSITINGFWTYKEGTDYMLNREAGILTAFSDSGIACTTNTDDLIAYYNYELYTAVTDEAITMPAATTTYDWLNLDNKAIVPYSERVHFTIDETYKGRKLYYTEGKDYTIDPDSGTMYILDGGRILDGGTVGLEMVNYELETKTIASQAMTYDFALLVGDSEYWKPIPNSEIISTTPARLMLMEENADYVLDRGTGWIKRVENGRILTTDSLTARLTYFNVINNSQSINASYAWQNLAHPKVASQSVRAQYTPSVSGHPDYSFVFQKDVDYNIEPESGTLTATPFNRFTESDTIKIDYQYLDLQEYLAKLVTDGITFAPVDSGIACTRLTTGANILGLNDGKVFNMQGKSAIEMINFGGTTVSGVKYFYGQPIVYGHTNIDNRQVGFIASLTGEKLVVLDQELLTNSGVTSVCESGHMYFAAGTSIYEYMGNNEYKKLYTHSAAIVDMRFVDNKLYFVSGTTPYLFEGGTHYAEASFITGSLNAGYRNVNKLFRKARIEFDSHPTGTLGIQLFESYKRLKEGAANNYSDPWVYNLTGTWDGNYLEVDIPDKFVGTDLYLRFKYTRPSGQNGSEFSIKGYDVEFLPCGELKLSFRVSIRAQLGITFRDKRVETRTPKEIFSELTELAGSKMPVIFKSLHNEEYTVKIDKITNEGMAPQTRTGETLVTLVLLEV